MANFGFEALTTIPGGLNYLGTWNAATNTPTITSSVGTPGDYYIVDVAGTTNIDGINDWGIGDWIIFSTSGVWQKIDNSEVVAATIYNSDGTLAGNRTVTMNTNTITFDGTDSDVKYTPNSAGGYLQLEGKASAVPRFSVSIPPYLAQPIAGFQLGMRAWDDAAFPGYGKVGDAFFYAGNATNGLNFLNPPGIGTEDYIRFYAGNNALATSDIHIQGTGATKGNVGIGTETPTEKLDVAGKTKTTTFQLTTAPTAGYVLTSDASGNGTWQLAGSSSGVFGIANTSGVYTFYATLTLAMAAATAGQTIEMFADVTESSVTAITLKNGVNINGNGHTYNYTAATGNCFIDNGLAVSCVIQNFNITRTGHTADNILRITNQNSVIDCTGSLFKCTCVNTSNAFVVVCGGTLTNCNVFATGTNIQGINAYSFGGKGILRNSTSETTGSGAAIYGDLLYSTNQEIFNCDGKSVSGIGIYGERIINSRGFSTSGTGISGSCYNSYGISSSSYGIQGGEVYNSTAISSSGAAILATSIVNSSAKSASGNALLPSSAANKFYNSSFYTAAAAVVAYFHVGNYYNCSLESTWNNANGHCISDFDTMVSTTEIVNCTLKVTNSSANCIIAVNASTPKYANNVYIGATTPINANITQGIVNTQDNQGNILL